MNAIIDDPKNTVIHESLDAAEQCAVEALVNQHRGNAALTQQLALDASRMLGASQDRLRRQSEAGFCRRLVSALSGKSSQNALSNQTDMLAMQKVAWHYLQQLQQQNLINAQAIAVIRNNLGTMNEYIIETRDFLDLAIDKINSRLRHVENNVRFTRWSLNIEANKRRYKSLSGALLVVQLSYDFLLKHRDVELTYEDINHLIVSLEELGINCDEDVRLLDFIIEIIDQLDLAGIDAYNRYIALSTNDYQLESSFIQANVSGLGFNALYYLSEQHSRIMSLINDDELCNSDAAREKIISRIFGDEFDGLSTTYSLRDLVSELVGGGLLAIAIYRDRMGLDVQPVEASADAPQEERLSLVSAFPDIQAHTYLDATQSAEDRHDYIRLLSLFIQNPADTSRLGSEFITHLAARAGTPAAAAAFLAAGAGALEIQAQLQRLKQLLGRAEDVYCWLLDAFFLLTIEQGKIETAEAMRVLNVLKPPQLKEHLMHLQSVLTGVDAEAVLNACAVLSKVTHAWTNVLGYREMRFAHTYAEPIQALGSVSNEAFKLQLELHPVTMKALEYSYYTDMSGFDASIFSKVGTALGSTTCTLGRRSSLSSLNQLRAKYDAFVKEKSPVIWAANNAVSRMGMPMFSFENECGYEDFDLNNAAENDDWSTQFDHCRYRIERTLEAFCNACNDAQRQLELFAGGDFTTSVVERRARAQREALQKQRDEELAKRSVVISRGGVEQRFSIEWEDVRSPPCDPETIRELRTNGQHWLIATNDSTYFHSSDGIEWCEVRPFGEESRTAREILLVNGVWLITCYGHGCAYSSDGRTWMQTQYPAHDGDYSLSATDEIVNLDGMWIWRFTRHRSYRYGESGIFSSQKSSFYTESVLFSAAALDGEWSRWEATPTLTEGMQIDALCGVPGISSLLIFCSMDHSYERDKKMTESTPQVMYYAPGKGWRTCTWNGDRHRRPDVSVTRMGDRLMCFASGQLLASVKGYEWTADPGQIRVHRCFHLDGVSLFSIWADSRQLRLSQDGSVFVEMTLEEGIWRHFGATEQGALSVHSPNAHETWLRTGRFVFQPA